MTEAAFVKGAFERGVPAGLASPNFSCRLSTGDWTGLELPGARAGTHREKSSSGTDGSSMYSGGNCLLIGLFPVLKNQGEESSHLMLSYDYDKFSDDPTNNQPIR